MHWESAINNLTSPQLLTFSASEEETENFWISIVKTQFSNNCSQQTMYKLDAYQQAILGAACTWMSQ